jgi:hypothetical protein
MAQQHAIDWSTADVSPDATGFELRVSLNTSGVDGRYSDTFNRIAERRNREARGSVAWTSIKLWGATIIVKGLAGDAHKLVRTELEEIVEATNAKVPEDERKAAELVQANAKHAEEKNALADTLTDIFRAAQDD